MRKFAFAAALAAALLGTGVAAVAADLPVKIKRRDVAPTPAPFAYPAASGFYGLLGTEGGAGSANVNVPGLNPNSITTTTIDAHLGLGYVWATGTGPFMGLQTRVGWQNFNGNSPGFSFSGPLALEERFYVGFPAQQVMQFFPTIFPVTPPPFTPPAGITVSSTNWYIGGTIDERDISLNFGETANKVWAIAPGVVLGQQNLLSNGLMADVYAKIRFDSLGACVGSQILGNACASLGTSYLAGLDLKWGI